MQVVGAVRVILDKHLGPPPTSIDVQGRDRRPSDYLRDVVGLDLDNYVNLMSLMQEPCHQWCEYKVPDNWWHSRDYFNVPLDECIEVVQQAARDRASLCLASTTRSRLSFPPGRGLRADVRHPRRVHRRRRAGSCASPTRAPRMTTCSTSWASASATGSRGT